MNTTAKVIVAAVAVALVVAGIVTMSLAARRANTVIVHMVGSSVHFRAYLREPIMVGATGIGSSKLDTVSLMAPRGYRVYSVRIDPKTFKIQSREEMHPSRVNTSEGPDFQIHDVFGMKDDEEYILLDK
jgi:hypothetical protein